MYWGHKKCALAGFSLFDVSSCRTNILRNKQTNKIHFYIMLVFAICYASFIKFYSTLYYHITMFIYPCILNEFRLILIQFTTKIENSLRT